MVSTARTGHRVLLVQAVPRDLQVPQELLALRVTKEREDRTVSLAPLAPR